MRDAVLGYWSPYLVFILGSLLLSMLGVQYFWEGQHLQNQKPKPKAKDR